MDQLLSELATGSRAQRTQFPFNIKDARICQKSLEVLFLAVFQLRALKVVELSFSSWDQKLALTVYYNDIRSFYISVNSSKILRVRTKVIPQWLVPPFRPCFQTHISEHSSSR